MKELRIFKNWRALIIKYRKIRNYDLAKILTPTNIKKLKIKVGNLPKIIHNAQSNPHSSKIVSAKTKETKEDTLKPKEVQNKNDDSVDMFKRAPSPKVVIVTKVEEL